MERSRPTHFPLPTAHIFVYTTGYGKWPSLVHMNSQHSIATHGYIKEYHDAEIHLVAVRNRQSFLAVYRYLGSEMGI